MMGVFKNQYGQVRSGWLILLLGIILFFFQLLLAIPFMKLWGTGSFAIGMSTELAIFLGVVFMWVLVQKKNLGEIGLHGNGTGKKDILWGLGLGALSML